MSPGEWVAVILAVPTVGTFLGASFLGIRKVIRERDAELRARAIAEYKAETYRTEAEELLAEKNRELQAYHASTERLTAEVKRYREVDVPRLQRIIDTQVETIARQAAELRDLPR